MAKSDVRTWTAGEYRFADGLFTLVRTNETDVELLVKQPGGGYKSIVFGYHYLPKLAAMFTDFHSAIG